jgi:hypothetical protein
MKYMDQMKHKNNYFCFFNKDHLKNYHKNVFKRNHKELDHKIKKQKIFASTIRNK